MAASQYRFRTDKREILIAEVAKRPCLWNKENTVYKNREVCRKEWMAVAEASGMDVESCKKLWKNLHDQFRRNCQLADKRMAENGADNGGGGGGGGEQAYGDAVKWTYFKSLLFLKDFLNPRYIDSPYADGKNSDETRDMDHDSSTFLSQISDESIKEIKQEALPDEPLTLSVDKSVREIKQEVVSEPAVTVTVHEVEAPPGPSRLHPRDYEDIVHVITSDPEYGRRRRRIRRLSSPLDSPPHRPAASLKRTKFSQEDMMGTLVRELEHATKELSRSRAESSEEKFASYVADLIGRVPKDVRAHCEFQVIKLINSYMNCSVVELNEN